MIKISKERDGAMALTYTEELVKEYFKHLTEDGTRDSRSKYFISEHVLFRDKGAKGGWRDIDVLAIGREEICIVQTKSFAIFKRDTKASIREAIRFFKQAERFVRQNYEVEGKKVKWVFVADVGLSQRFRRELEAQAYARGKEIEIRSLKEVALKFFKLLRELYPDAPSQVGKEENNVTRILLFLTYAFKREFRREGLLT